VILIRFDSVYVTEGETGTWGQETAVSNKKIRNKRKREIPQASQIHVLEYALPPIKAARIHRHKKKMMVELPHALSMSSVTKDS
jgi:hypothetical protein